MLTIFLSTFLLLRPNKTVYSERPVTKGDVRTYIQNHIKNAWFNYDKFARIDCGSTVKNPDKKFGIFFVICDSKRLENTDSIPYGS